MPPVLVGDHGAGAGGWRIWVPVEGEYGGGRMGLGGNFWREEMKSSLPCFDLCFFFFKKKKKVEKQKTDVAHATSPS